MNDNAFIFGAGASFDAKVPLLGDFMDRIFELSQSNRTASRAPSKEEQKILERVIEIRDSLERYQPRVSINQFNLEEVLSVLSFEAMIGEEGGETKLKEFIQAIALVIEITCSVTHDGRLNLIQESGPEVYREFWKTIFKHLPHSTQKVPAIISFNYDLVMERSLFQIGTHTFSGNRQVIPSRGIILNYQNPKITKNAFQLNSGDFWINERGGAKTIQGVFLEQIERQTEYTENFLNIDLFKLHGSVNFPSNDVSSNWSPVLAVESPQVIPPVFNKASNSYKSDIWKSAFETLRNCKNLIICGYSLPTSDTYMQYFLKAALGPNRKLNKVIVFDPVLFESSEAGKSLRNRYSVCFSPQMQGKIIFQPTSDFDKIRPGTFEHLVKILSTSPADILFGFS